MQELVDEIMQLGHVPTQSKKASTEEKRVAVRLLRARKAGSLTWEQEAALGSLAEALRGTREGLARTAALAAARSAAIPRATRRADRAGPKKGGALSK